MNDERRQYQRVEFDANAILYKDDQLFECQIIDLSIHGVLLRPEGIINSSMSDLYELRIPLDTENNFIHMALRLTHKHPSNLGFVCENLDIDSITHLRKIVELNSGDPSILNRDFATLCESNN